MKVLWMTNKLIGSISELFGVKNGGFGGWMEMAFDEVTADSSMSLVIVTSAKCKSLVKKVDGNVTYYVLPCGDAYSKYRCDDRKGNQYLHEIIKNEVPDLIHLWGTESELGLSICRATPDIPKIVYVQGVMNAIERHYYETTSRKYLKRCQTVHDYLKKQRVVDTDRRTKRKAASERQVLNMSHAIITDNEWCVAFCRGINPKLDIYKQNLPISQEFVDAEWVNNKDSHTIFCASQYAPFKGFETILRAIKMVKNRYPDVLLLVPGGWNNEPISLKKKLQYSGYSNAMNKLIKSLDLCDNVKSLGGLSRKQMAENMSRATVVVQASSAENHASTLREALHVGAPCIASTAGSTVEYIKHGENGYLYRENEPELLAYYLIKLFEDNQLRTEIGEAGRRAIKEFYSKESMDIICIYKNVISSFRE